MSVCLWFWLHFSSTFSIRFNPFSLVYLCVCIALVHMFACTLVYLFILLHLLCCALFFVLGTQSERAGEWVCRKVNAPRQHLIKCRSISAAAFHLFIVKNRVTRAYNIIVYRGNIHTNTLALTAHGKKELPRVYREKNAAWCLAICSSLCEKELGCTREYGCSIGFNCKSCAWMCMPRCCSTHIFHDDLSHVTLLFALRYKNWIYLHNIFRWFFTPLSLNLCECVCECVVYEILLHIVSKRLDIYHFYLKNMMASWKKLPIIEIILLVFNKWAQKGHAPQWQWPHNFQKQTTVKAKAKSIETFKC